jgi:hypothetical protein
MNRNCMTDAGIGSMLAELAKTIFIQCMYSILAGKSIYRCKYIYTLYGVIRCMYIK